MRERSGSSKRTKKPIAQVARDLGVNEGHAGELGDQVTRRADGSSSLSTGDYEELKRLRAEVAELRMERDVPERSVVLWVKEATSERGTLHRRPEEPTTGCHTHHLRPARGEPGGSTSGWAARTARPRVSGLHTDRDRRRDTIDRAVAVMFRKRRGLHGSPRLHTDLVEDGWVEREDGRGLDASAGPVARKMKRRNGMNPAGQDGTEVPDLLRRDFTAERSQRPLGRGHDQILTAGGKLYLATVIDLYSRGGCRGRDRSAPGR